MLLHMDHMVSLEDGSRSEPSIILVEVLVEVLEQESKHSCHSCAVANRTGELDKHEASAASLMQKITLRLCRSGVLRNL